MPNEDNNDHLFSEGFKDIGLEYQFNAKVNYETYRAAEAIGGEDFRDMVVENTCQLNGMFAYTLEMVRAQGPVPNGSFTSVLFFTFLILDHLVTRSPDVAAILEEDCSEMLTTIFAFAKPFLVEYYKYANIPNGAGETPTDTYQDLHLPREGIVRLLGLMALLSDGRYFNMPEIWGSYSTADSSAEVAMAVADPDSDFRKALRSLYTKTFGHFEK